MKKFNLLSVVCLYGCMAFGQIEWNSKIGGGQIRVADIDGRPLNRKYDGDISGSPFLEENWNKAILILSNGKKIGPMNVKLDIESNELHYADSSGREYIANDGQVKQINFISLYTKDSLLYVFRNGYPSIQHQNENFFYQVLAEGKMDLLAKKSKYLRVSKNDLSGEISKDVLESATVYYVATKRTIEEFHPYYSFILTIMRDKADEISNYMETNKMNLKRKPDIIKLVNYYNRL